MTFIQTRRKFLRSTLTLALAGWVSACDRAIGPTISVATPTIALPEHFSGNRAFAHAATQMQWVPRDTGSPGWKQCGDYIAAQLAIQGWKIEEQTFTYKDTNCRNIIGKLGRGRHCIIGADYDSLRRADQ